MVSRPATVFPQEGQDAGADYVGIAEAFTNLLLPYLPNVASSSRNDQSGAAIDALEEFELDAGYVQEDLMELDTTSNV